MHTLQRLRCAAWPGLYDLVASATSSPESPASGPPLKSGHCENSALWIYPSRVFLSNKKYSVGLLLNRIWVFSHWQLQGKNEDLSACVQHCVWYESWGANGRGILSPEQKNVWHSAGLNFLIKMHFSYYRNSLRIKHSSWSYFPCIQATWTKASEIISRVT